MNPWPAFSIPSFSALFSGEIVSDDAFLILCAVKPKCKYSPKLLENENRELKLPAASSGEFELKLGAHAPNNLGHSSPCTACVQ
jgi:hypothetical protein